MNSKAIILSGPEPIELGMWGMLSSYMFRVSVRGEIATIEVHFQRLTSVAGTEFQAVSFKGYDQITGRRVRCGLYHSTSRDKKFGIILISQQKARPTELSKKYGPGGWKLRKKPLKLSVH